MCLFFSTVEEELRVWVISGFGFPPPFAALGGMVVNVLMCGLGIILVVVVVVIADVRGNVVFGFYLVWKPIGEFSVMCNLLYAHRNQYITFPNFCSDFCSEVEWHINLVPT